MRTTSICVQAQGRGGVAGHAFTGWRGDSTDSGGFNFQPGETLQDHRQSVTFQSHTARRIHHAKRRLKSRRSRNIIMAFDQCVALPASRAAFACGGRIVGEALSGESPAERSGALGIVQGGLEADLRRQSAQELVALDFEGYAIGGLSVGESKADMYAMLDVTAPELPEAKPRYLMGVGLPEDLIEGVARGVDLFDCVVPSRHGRTGWLFTGFGRVSIKQAQYKQDERPIDQDCGCPVCKRYSRAYLHHLFNVKEMLGARLNTIHNLWYFSIDATGALSIEGDVTVRNFSTGSSRSMARRQSSCGTAGRLDWRGRSQFVCGWRQCVGYEGRGQEQSDAALVGAVRSDFVILFEQSCRSKRKQQAMLED
jgi:queuine tRNA-ribosyltransferase